MVSLGVALSVPVGILSSGQHLTLLPVNLRLSAIQVAHGKPARRATETLGRTRRVAGEAEQGGGLAGTGDHRLLSKDHLTGGNWPGGHYQPAHTLPLLHLPGETLTILLPPMESQVLRRAGERLSASRTRKSWSSTEEAGPLVPSPCVRHASGVCVFSTEQLSLCC